jgi:rare lipoprotein A
MEEVEGWTCPPVDHLSESGMFRAFSFLVLAVFVLSLSGCASHIRMREGATQRGLATWYGPGSNGDQTADGETFNMNDLTAAHRHIPFGSIVRVTNLDNGRSVDVRINDRGPYGYRSRIIDVSSAAADILQMKRAGIVPVEIEIISLGDGRYHHQ